MIKEIVKEFNRGIELIETLDDTGYSKGIDGAASIGAHFRHNIDFAGNFLGGLESGKINYNERDRDLRIETSREYAKDRMRFLIKSLRDLSGEKIAEAVLVSSEVEENVWHESSVSRELEFLHSHTVHHYALIVEKLKSQGREIDSDFGVAPSTLKFWAKKKSRAKVA